MNALQRARAVLLSDYGDVMPEVRLHVPLFYPKASSKTVINKKTDRFPVPSDDNWYGSIV